MPEIKKENYYLGMYYFEFPQDSPILNTFGPFGLGGNILTQVWAENQNGKPDGPRDWIIHQRFRYYKDGRIGEHNEDIFNSHAYVGRNKTAEQVEKEVHSLLQVISVAALSPEGGRYEFINLNCQGGDEVIQKLIEANKPWMHITTVSKEDAEKRGWVKVEPPAAEG